MSGLRDGLLVGRDDELRLPRELIEQLRAGRGRTLLIEGEPGIGKTALVREAAALASAGGAGAVGVRCRRLGRRGC